MLVPDGYGYLFTTPRVAQKLKLRLHNYRIDLLHCFVRPSWNGKHNDNIIAEIHLFQMLVPKDINDSPRKLLSCTFRRQCPKSNPIQIMECV